VITRGLVGIGVSIIGFTKTVAEKTEQSNYVGDEKHPGM
jgi:hypothetical protein